MAEWQYREKSLSIIVEFQAKCQSEFEFDKWLNRNSRVFYNKILRRDTSCARLYVFRIIVSPMIYYIMKKKRAHVKNERMILDIIFKIRIIHISVYKD